jgi:hypothetical protein
LFLKSARDPAYDSDAEYGDRFIHCYLGDSSVPESDFADDRLLSAGYVRDAGPRIFTTALKGRRDDPEELTCRSVVR